MYLIFRPTFAVFDEWYSHTLEIIHLVHERRFRAGIAAKLITFNQFTRFGNLALLAIFTRCVFMLSSRLILC